MSEKKILKFLLVVFFSILFCVPTFAEDSTVSTNEIVSEIERVLLFDKDSYQKIDFYRKENSKQKSDYTLKRGDDTEGRGESVEIIVSDSKINNFNILEKERLAYNANLIGQYEVAVEIYKQILKDDPENFYAKFSLAIVYQKIGQYRQAKALYYQLLKTNPENREEIVGNLLAILVEESPRDSIYLLSRLTIENPKSAFILAQGAIAYDKIKNYEQAKLLLERAVLLDQDNISYKYNLAVIYDKTNEFEKALELYIDVAKNYNDSNYSVPIDQVNKRIVAIKNKL